MNRGAGTPDELARPWKRYGPRIAFAVAVWIGAAIYSWGGIFYTMDWLDEGQIVYPAWRVSQGAVPYVDFTHLYGPSLFYLNGALLAAFGTELETLRVLLVVLKATAATLMALCILEVASMFVTLGAVILLVAVWGAPWGFFTTPYASFYGLTLSLLGTLLFLRAGPRPVVHLILSGLCFGFAATFKQTAGFLPFLSVLVLLVADRRPITEGAEPSAWLDAFGRLFRAAAPIVALAFSVFYLGRDGHLLATSLLGGPFCIAIFFLLITDLTEPVSPRVRVESLRRGVWLSVGAAVPVLGYLVHFARLGHLGSFVSNTATTLASKIHWTVELAWPSEAVFAWCATGVAILWFGSAWNRGRARETAAAGLVLALVGSALVLGTVSKTWPHQHSVIGFLSLLPALLVWPALTTLIRGESPENQAPRAFFLLAATSLFYLHPGWDVWHALLALPMYLPLLAFHLDRAYFQSERQAATASSHDPPTRSPVPRWLAYGVVGVVVVSLATPFASARRNAAAQAPTETIPLDAARGISLQPALRDGVALAKTLQSPEYRERPLIVLSGEHLFYYLTGRVSPIEEHEFLLYLISIDAVTPESARELADPSELIERIDEVRPLLIVDRNKGRAKRFTAAFPSLAEHVSRNYTEIRSFGTRLLLDRHDPTPPAGNSPRGGARE